jgi:D-arabinose 1-dehydrogenase-like Zn-dependent alcohol dehydrogenase
MRVAVMRAPGDVRVEEHDEPAIVEPTDAVIRITASCVCGSDLWAYRGVEKLDGPRRMGHEVFDLALPLADAADGYAAMDERRAVKVLLTA